MCYGRKYGGWFSQLLRYVGLIGLLTFTTSFATSETINGLLPIQYGLSQDFLYPLRATEQSLWKVNIQTQLPSVNELAWFVSAGIGYRHVIAPEWMGGVYAAINQLNNHAADSYLLNPGIECFSPLGRININGYFFIGSGLLKPINNSVRGEPHLQRGIDGRFSYTFFDRITPFIGGYYINRAEKTAISGAFLGAKYAFNSQLGIEAKWTWGRVNNAFSIGIKCNFDNQNDRYLSGAYRALWQPIERDIAAIALLPDALPPARTSSVKGKERALSVSSNSKQATEQSDINSQSSDIKSPVFGKQPVGYNSSVFSPPDRSLSSGYQVSSPLAGSSSGYPESSIASERNFGGDPSGTSFAQSKPEYTDSENEEPAALGSNQGSASILSGTPRANAAVNLSNINIPEMHSMPTGLDLLQGAASFELPASPLFGRKLSTSAPPPATSSSQAIEPPSPLNNAKELSTFKSPIEMSASPIKKSASPPTTSTIPFPDDSPLPPSYADVLKGSQGLPIPKSEEASKVPESQKPSGEGFHAGSGNMPDSKNPEGWTGY